MINVLIVEDDPMVATINQSYVNMLEGFSVAGVVANSADAQAVLANQRIELILLDVYLQNESGVDLFTQLNH